MFKTRKYIKVSRITTIKVAPMGLSIMNIINHYNATRILYGVIREVVHRCEVRNYQVDLDLEYLTYLRELFLEPEEVPVRRRMPGAYMPEDIWPDSPAAMWGYAKWYSRSGLIQALSNARDNGTQTIAQREELLGGVRGAVIEPPYGRTTQFRERGLFVCEAHGIWAVDMARLKQAAQSRLRTRMDEDDGGHRGGGSVESDSFRAGQDSQYALDKTIDRLLKALFDGEGLLGRAAFEEQMNLVWDPAAP